MGPSVQPFLAPTLCAIGFETDDKNERQRGSCGHQILTADIAGLCEAPCGAAGHGSGRCGPADEPRGDVGSAKRPVPLLFAQRAKGLECAPLMTPPATHQHSPRE